MRRWIGGGIIIILAACSAPTENLPTLVSLPSTVPTLVAEVGGTLPPRPNPLATLPASFTPTDLPTATPTATLPPTLTLNPSATITDTPSPSPTDEPTIPPEDRPVTSLLQLAAQVTLLPSDFVVPAYEGITITLVPTYDPFVALAPVSTVYVAAACPYYPPAPFAVAYTNTPDVALSLGCPLGNPPNVLNVPTAWQPYQNGTMLWINGDIYVLYNTGSYQYFPDTFVAGVDAETLTEVPPVGLLAPVRGFAKVWSQNAGVRSGLGWALTAETGQQSARLDFTNGLMLQIPGRSDTLIIVGGKTLGTWRGVLIP